MRAGFAHIPRAAVWLASQTLRIPYAKSVSSECPSPDYWEEPEVRRDFASLHNQKCPSRGILFWRASEDGTTNLLKSRSIVFLVVSGIRTTFPPIGRISTQRGHSAELGLNSCKENCFPDSRLISLSEMSSKPYPSATSLRSSGGTSRRIEPSYFKFTKREGESLSAPSYGNWRTAARSPHPGSPTRKPADVQQYFTSMPASS